MGKISYYWNRIELTGPVAGHPSHRKKGEEGKCLDVFLLVHRLINQKVTKTRNFMLERKEKLSSKIIQLEFSFGRKNLVRKFSQSISNSLWLRSSQQNFPAGANKRSWYTVYCYFCNKKKILIVKRGLIWILIQNGESAIIHW